MEMLRRWAQDYGRLLSTRFGDLADHFVEPELAPRRSAASRVETPDWYGHTRDSSRKSMAASQLLQRDGSRRNLLLGPPACGKTATSLFLATRLVHQFLDGGEERFPLLLQGRELAEEDRSLW